MVSRNAESDYEITLKILSMLELSKPVALVTISQASGIKLADIIRYCNQLIQEKIIERSVDNGNLFYILKTEEYEKKVASIFNVTEKNQPPAKPINSREEIMKRRSRRASGIHEKVSADDRQSIKNSAEMSKTRRSAGPERITALDLLAMKRSSAALARVVEPGRSSARIQAVSSTINPRQSRENDAVRNSSSALFSQSGLHPSITERRVSSTTQKAVYINKPTSRKPDTRSSFNNIMPPSALEQSFLERSDANFKQTNPFAGRMQLPLIPENALVSNNTEIPEDVVRKELLIREDMPLITILSPRPCHDVWSACSALANTGGGYIILGMRKYIKDDNVTYYIKSIANPEDAVKNILKGFNDRNIISDCPKDPSFITYTQIRKKNIIIMHIDPSMFAPAPIYTARDSFGMKTNQGCYLYIDDEIIHCSQEDVKQLWIQRRLGNDIPDWKQTGEQVEQKLERQMKLHMPVQIDDAVRPLSRKVNTYGQPLEPAKYSRHKRKKRPESEMYEGEKILAAGGFPKYSKNSAQSPHFARVAKEEPQQNDVRPVNANSHIDGTLQSLLFAEDIRVPNNTYTKQNPTAGIPKSLADLDVRNLNKHTAVISSDEDADELEEQSISQDIPPLFEDADMSVLDEIVCPVIDHPRLPMARVAEIAASLCLHARFTISDLAKILHKKPTPIKDKIMPKLRANPNFTEYKGTFYIKS